MREKVIIFDGNNPVEIGAEYFFQHPSIRDIDKFKARSILQATLVFEDTIKEIMSNPNLLEEVKEDVITVEYLSRVTRGRKILEHMVKDMWGDDVGSIIINKSKEVIDEEKESSYE